ncbi:hypothetical protein, partial [Klebsiella pneumoniae]
MPDALLSFRKGFQPPKVLCANNIRVSDHSIRIYRRVVKAKSWRVALTEENASDILSAHRYGTQRINLRILSTFAYIDGVTKIQHTTYA